MRYGIIELAPLAVIMEPNWLVRDRKFISCCITTMSMLNSTVCR